MNFSPHSVKFFYLIPTRLECTDCKRKDQVVIKRCKHFELGGEKKKKGQMLQF